MLGLYMFTTAIVGIIMYIHNYYSTDFNNYFYENTNINENNNIKKKNDYIDYLIEEKKTIKKKYFNKVLEELINNNNYVKWVYENNINILKDYRLVIIDMRIIFDYDTNSFTDLKYLENLSKYCHKNKIIFVIISELHPKFFPDVNYFNKNNLVTPFNYRKKRFGGVIRLPISQFVDTSVNVSINKLILDVMNQYGINNNKMIYINNENINNINTFIKKIQ
jgi:hypothetical protein